MKNVSRHQGKLEIIKRLPSSVNGNARFLCYCGGFTFQTTPDSCLADYVKNYVGKDVEICLGTYYGKTSLFDIKLI